MKKKFYIFEIVNSPFNDTFFQAVSVIKSLGGNVKMLVTNPKEEEEKNKQDKSGDKQIHQYIIKLKAIIGYLQIQFDNFTSEFITSIFNLLNEVIGNK